MARKKRRLIDSESEPELDISSLIDVCFLLLIYFLVTSTITPRETDLGMALPAANPTNEQPEIEPMFIRVDIDGVIYTGVREGEQTLDQNTDDRNVPLLDKVLNLYAVNARSAGSNPLVQVYVDLGATQQRVIDVLNSLAGADIKSITFTDLVE